jgi:hypothetical protein
MFVLRIEHPVPDFDAWKAEGFDTDPIGRERGGVRRYRILRPVDDPHFVMIDLEFDTADRAEAFRGELHDMWGRVQERFGWTEIPRARIVEAVDARDY